ncbi:MAG: sulfatase, partial [bacterium]|nr:sulfatase [bacterium]
LLDSVGLTPPAGPDLPGRSFLPALLGQSDPGRESLVICDEYGPTRMVRNDEFKYVHRYDTGPGEFYDLRNDPDERTNLIDDADRKGRISDMRGLLEDWFARYVRPDRDGRNFPVIGGGQLRPVGGPGEDGRDAFTGH